MLERSGWAVVDKNAINWSLGPGVAVREYQTDVGPADYVLFVDRGEQCQSLNRESYEWTIIPFFKSIFKPKQRNR